MAEGRLGRGVGWSVGIHGRGIVLVLVHRQIAETISQNPLVKKKVPQGNF